MTSLNRAQNPKANDWPVRPSPAVAATVTLLALLAILAVSVSGLHGGLRLALIVVVLIYAFAQTIRLLRPRWRALALEQGALTVVDQQRRRHRVSLRGRPFVSPLYIGLSGRSDIARQRLAIGVFRGQLAPDHFRRLAAALRSDNES